MLGDDGARYNLGSLVLKCYGMSINIREDITCLLLTRCLLVDLLLVVRSMYFMSSIIGKE